MEQPCETAFLQSHQLQPDCPPAVTDESINPDTAVTYIQGELY